MTRVLTAAVALLLTATTTDGLAQAQAGTDTGGYEVMRIRRTSTARGGAGRGDAF